MQLRQLPTGLNVDRNELSPGALGVKSQYVLPVDPTDVGPRRINGAKPTGRVEMPATAVATVQERGRRRTIHLLAT